VTTATPDRDTATVDLPAPARALAVGAHPDDVEFGCGATLAKWVDAGTEVHLLVLTDGSKGSWDPDDDQRALVSTRKREQQAAASALGASRVHFLDLVDGELGTTRGEVGAVCEVLRAVQADVVLGHDPWKRYRLHPDHAAAGRLVVEGIVAARDPHFFPRLGPSHRPDHLLLFEPDLVDHVERVDGWLDAKLAALFAHRSQWRSTMGIEVGTPDEESQTKAFVERIRVEAERAGEAVGVGFGEAFKRIDEL
jgi:LmbE family N-acetylglucosaminyl deacetylase